MLYNFFYFFRLYLRSEFTGIWSMIPAKLMVKFWTNWRTVPLIQLHVMLCCILKGPGVSRRLQTLPVKQLIQRQNQKNSHTKGMIGKRRQLIDFDKRKKSVFLCSKFASFSLEVIKIRYASARVKLILSKSNIKLNSKEMYRNVLKQ